VDEELRVKIKTIFILGILLVSSVALILLVRAPSTLNESVSLEELERNNRATLTIIFQTKEMLYKEVDIKTLISNYAHINIPRTLGDLKLVMARVDDDGDIILAYDTNTVEHYWEAKLYVYIYDARWSPSSYEDVERIAAKTGTLAININNVYGVGMQSPNPTPYTPTNVILWIDGYRYNLNYIGSLDTLISYLEYFVSQ
jgi:hypothetical protein